MTSSCVRALARGAAAAGAIIVAGGSALAQSGEVNVYTYRESKLEPHRHKCVWRDLNPAPRGSQPRMQHPYTTDTAEGVGVEPTRPCGSRAFQARPVTSRVAHPIANCGLSIASRV